MVQATEFLNAGDPEPTRMINMINAFNEPYLPGPAVNPTQTSFGQISASNQNNYARRLQWGVKFQF